MSTPFSKEQWAKDFLAALGNTAPSPQVVAFVWGWQQMESGSGDVSPADYNPLNTTQYMPNATDYNNAGVQNYASYDDGIQANKTALLNGDYPGLSFALQENNGALLSTASVAGDLTVWVSGERSPVDTGYVSGILELMTQHEGSIGMPLIVNKSGMVLDIVQSYQLEPGESQDLCGPWSVASLTLAGLPNTGPRGTAEQVDEMADAWADQWLAGGHVGALGSTVQDMYDFLQAATDPKSGQRALHWWDLVTFDAAHVRAAVQAGYVVLITVNEESLVEKKTGACPPYPWNLNATHILPVAGVDHDGDFICADELNNAFQGYWPPVYIASKMNISWASAIQVVGPDPSNPWMKPIPNNDPTTWPQGFNAQNFSKGTQTQVDNVQAAFDAEWDTFVSQVAVMFSKLGLPMPTDATIAIPPKGTGIYKASLADYRTGKFHGPPISWEYPGKNWAGKPITIQQFVGGHYEWDGTAHWYPHS